MSNTLQLADLASHIGQELGVSAWITIDQPRIDEFAHCTGDHQWIHVDVERASTREPLRRHRRARLPDPGAAGRRTTFEIVVAKMQLKQAVNYGLDKVRFIAPVRAGKRVRNRIRWPQWKTRAMAASWSSRATRSRSRARTSPRSWPRRWPMLVGPT